jgi:hypothetical protein
MRLEIDSCGNSFSSPDEEEKRAWWPGPIGQLVATVISRRPEDQNRAKNNGPIPRLGRLLLMYENLELRMKLKTNLDLQTRRRVLNSRRRL